MNTQAHSYELRKGVILSAEDVSIVPAGQQAAPAPSAPMPRVVATAGAQQSLDLKPPPRRPWEAANPRVKTSIRLEMPEELHMKLAWIKDNVPNSAISAVCRRAVEAAVAQILAEHDAAHRA